MRLSEVTATKSLKKTAALGDILSSVDIFISEETVLQGGGGGVNCPI